MRASAGNGGKNEQQNVPAEDLTEFLINAMVASAEDGDD
jgi:histidyl-tRNA synthetase